MAPNSSIKPYAAGEVWTATSNQKEEIGRGIFGVVYKGELKSSSTTVVVRLLDGRYAGERVQEIAREI